MRGSSLSIRTIAGRITSLPSANSTFIGIATPGLTERDATIQDGQRESPILNAILTVIGETDGVTYVDWKMCHFEHAVGNERMYEMWEGCDCLSPGEKIV